MLFLALLPFSVALASTASAQETLEVPVKTTDEAEVEAEVEVETEALVEDETEVETPSNASSEQWREPEVALDELLRLPNSLDFKEERRGGDGASDWRRRFSESEQSVADAQAKLDATEAAMAEAGTAGSGQWQIAPPGQQANSSDQGPLSFKLREDLRRARAALESIERQHRALVVEADLAGVPEAWRQTRVQ